MAVVNKDKLIDAINTIEVSHHRKRDRRKSQHELINKSIMLIYS